MVALRLQCIHRGKIQVVCLNIVEHMPHGDFDTWLCLLCRSVSRVYLALRFLPLLVPKLESAVAMPNQYGIVLRHVSLGQIAVKSVDSKL